MSASIILNNLPNVFVDSVTITESNDKTVIMASVFLKDNLDIFQRKWSSKKSLPKIKINASLVEGNRDIANVKSRAVVLRNKDVASVTANRHGPISQDRNHVKYSYNIRIKLDRKISNDSSLFFYTSLNTARMQRVLKNSNTVGKKLNHGIYAKSKKLKAPKLKQITGGVKHLPLFIDGKKVKKLTVYKQKLSGMTWHGDVKYSIGKNSYMTNVPKIKSTQLMTEKVDNNIVIYNIPLKTIKDNKKGVFPIKKAMHKKMRHIKKINSLHNKAFKYEMDEQIDADGNLHKFFMINLCNIALSRSKVAQKIYRTNKDLFMQIGESLTIGRIKIERSKFKSLAKAKRNKKSKYKKNRKKYNTKTNRNRRVVAQLNMRKQASLGGLFDIDDKLFKRKGAKPSANLQIINAGLPTEVKALYFVDRKTKQAGRGRLSYKVNVDFDDLYYRYVKATLRDILLFKKEILGIKNSAVKTKAYSRRSGKIKDTFIAKYFNKQNIGMGANGIQNNDSLENSPIVKGIVAVDTASLLLGLEAEDLQIDSKVNFKNATPSTLRTTVKDLDKIIYLLQKRYNIVPTFNKVSGRGKGVSSRINKKRKVINKEFNLTIDNDIKKEHVLYRFMNFGNELKIDKTGLKSRANMEISKYFNGMPTNTDVVSGRFDDKTRASLIDLNHNKYRFLTTVSVNSGKHRSDTRKFDQKVNTKFFTIIKTIRKKVLSNKKIKSVPFNVRDNIPTTIIPDTLIVEDEKKENVISATKFLGKASPFIGHSFLKKNFNRMKLKSSVEKVSKNFAFDDKSIKTIAAYDIDNDKSIIYQQIQDKKIDPADIPLQIKSLILNKSKAVKTNFLSNKDDIFKNPKTDELAYQMYGNIYELKYIEGFEMSSDGMIDMKRPIIKPMSTPNYDSLNGSNKICFMHRYENKMIMRKKDPFKVVGDVFLLIDRGEAPMAPKGMTSLNANHHHKYNVDENGNGYTSIAVHPKNPNIRHRHKIVNWVVQKAKSSCYPKCKDRYGVEGAPMHGHNVMKRTSMSKIRSKSVVAQRFLSNFNNENANPTQQSTQGATPATTSTTTPQVAPAMTPPMGGSTSGY